MTNFQKILKKVPNVSFEYAWSRTTKRRHKTWKVKKRLLYFWIWVSFNIDWNRQKLKPKYKKIVENIKNSLDEKDLDFLLSWVENNFYRVSKHVKTKEVNSKWKLFMHLLYILPYVKYNVEEKSITNIEGFISRTIFNCTRSWYTNYCKKYNPSKLWENV